MNPKPQGLTPLFFPTRGELYLGTNAWVADKRDPARWKASVLYQEMLYSMLAAMGPALTKAQRAEYLQAAESAKLQYQNEVWMQGLIEGVARDKDGRIE